MKNNITLLVTLLVLTLSQSMGQRPDETMRWQKGLEEPAQSLREALRLVELYSSSQDDWLNQSSDYLIHSSDFERSFVIYGDGYCLLQVAGWEGFKVDTELDQHTWFIGYQHPHLDKQVVFRVMRDGQVTVLVPEDALLMAGR